jgi:hypothetical protein
VLADFLKPNFSAAAALENLRPVYFSPTQPAGIKRGNWVQTMPNKGWFVILRLYGPLEPFFSKKWRASEIGPVL